METEAIPVAEYQKFTAGFNPAPGSPRKWAQLAKAAGMKYMVLTSKHHEGFCNWDTKLTNYNAVNYGPKRDILKEYVEAARAEGLRVVRVGNGPHLRAPGIRVAQALCVTSRHRIVQRVVDHEQRDARVPERRDRVHAPQGKSVAPVRVCETRLDDRAHRAAGQVGQPAEGEGLEQLAGREARARLAQLGQRPGQGFPISAVSARQDVGPDELLHPAQAGALVGAAGPLLRLRRVVEAGDAGHHALQRGRLRHRGTPLGLGVVGAAEHPDGAVRARHPGGPLHRVVPVVELLLARDELAVGGVAAADVLHDDHVARSGESHGVGVHQVDVDVLVVRLPRQEHRVRAAVGGAVDVGAQHDPVPHRTLDIVLDEDVTARRYQTGHEPEPYVGAAVRARPFHRADSPGRSPGRSVGSAADASGRTTLVKTQIPTSVTASRPKSVAKPSA